MFWIEIWCLPFSLSWNIGHVVVALRFHGPFNNLYPSLTFVIGLIISGNGMVTSNTTFNKSLHLNKPPPFGGERYIVWKARMKLV